MRPEPGWTQFTDMEKRRPPIRCALSIYHAGAQSRQAAKPGVFAAWGLRVRFLASRAGRTNRVVRTCTRRCGFVVLLVLLMALGACRGGTPPAPEASSTPLAALPEETLAPLVAASLTAWQSPTPPAPRTPPPTSTPRQTPVPTVTPTPDPLGVYTIDHLAARDYGGGQIEILGVLAENSWFTRYEFRYPSDGLTVYGFLNVPVPGGPAGEGPYPAIIALHGYIDPAIYNTLDYTTRYADDLARAGYIVFHPNLRNYPPSDQGDNLFRVGMAVDVLNLIALVQAGGLPEVLAGIRPERIGLWGHSMGGGVSTRVITVSDKVQAAVLYAAMSGDERQNFEAINRGSGAERGLAELGVPEGELQRISPDQFFDRIQAHVSIHHGRADALVPLAWSIQTCDALTQLAVSVECVYYDGMPHTFFGEGDQAFIRNVIAFYDRILKDGG